MDINKFNISDQIYYTAHIDDELKNILSKISFKFYFKDNLYVDFMDYFPHLKNGQTTIPIIKNIINLSSICDKNKELLKMFDNRYKIIECFLVHVKFMDDKYEQLEKETKISGSLYKMFVQFYNNENEKVSLNKKNNLDDILSTILIYGGGLCKPLYDELINDDYISLLFSIFRRNKTDIIAKLLIDEIHPLNGTLYEFALKRYTYDHIKPRKIKWIETEEYILDIIKYITIKRVWLEKYAIKNMFGDISDDIYQHINKFI